MPFLPSVPHRLYTVCKLYCNVFKFCVQSNIAEKPVFTCKFCPLPASTQNFENLCLLQEASSPVGYTQCQNCVATCFNFACKVTSAETPFFVCKFCHLPASTQNFENICLLQEASSPIGYTRCANCVVTCLNFACKVTSPKSLFSLANFVLCLQVRKTLKTSVWKLCVFADNVMV